jgi:hypothetical protein
MFLILCLSAADYNFIQKGSIFYNVSPHAEVAAYNIAEVLVCQAKASKLDRKILLPTPSPSDDLGRGFDRPAWGCWASVLDLAFLQPARFFVLIVFFFSFSLFSRISASSRSLCLPDAFLFTIKSSFDITEISSPSTTTICLLK